MKKSSDSVMSRHLGLVNGENEEPTNTIRFQEGQDGTSAGKSSDCDVGKVLRVKKMRNHALIYGHQWT